MRRQDPIKKALDEYKDGVVIVHRQDFVPIPTNLHEEVEMMAALSYAESRAHAQGSIHYVSREHSVDLTEMSLHDALADDANPLGAVGDARRSYGQKRR